jgi:hypothetical protein
MKRIILIILLSLNATSNCQTYNNLIPDSLIISFFRNRVPAFGMEDTSDINKIVVNKYIRKWGPNEIKEMMRDTNAKSIFYDTITSRTQYNTADSNIIGFLVKPILSLWKNN